MGRLKQACKRFGSYVPTALRTVPLLLNLPSIVALNSCPSSLCIMLINYLLISQEVSGQLSVLFLASLSAGCHNLARNIEYTECIV